ncbi:hypothetical protein B0H21DRAFT_812892 [Amylocystis lapponica]|nr:hypothetical protein B0H21DRAFT_812892 [Amylocystis lapponica]
MSNPEPSWPSLYNFLIEIWPFAQRDPVQYDGRYVYGANVIFRFTLYWTLLLYVPTFLACGAYAFFNLTFPPKWTHPRTPRNRLFFSFPFSPFADPNHQIPLQPYSDLSADTHESVPLQHRSLAKQNEKRSRLTFGLLVLLMFAIVSVAGAVIGSALIGYVLAGLYKAGHYNMSTWVPFLGALLQTLVCFLGLWPEVVDII